MERPDKARRGEKTIREDEKYMGKRREKMTK